jgi:hypothetical protein
MDGFDREAPAQVGNCLHVKEFVYRRQIRVSKDDLVAAKAGRKNCTIRLGRMTVEGTEIDLTDGRERARIRILETDTAKTLAQLTLREVMGEGFSSLDELTADLRRYYPHARGNDPVTVIWFEMIR